MGITSIRIRPEIEGPLNALTKKLDRSKNYLINQAIKEFIARQSEEDRRWQETLEAIHSVEAGKRVPEEDVNRWLESWGNDEELEPPAP